MRLSIFIDRKLSIQEYESCDLWHRSQDAEFARSLQSFPIATIDFVSDEFMIASELRKRCDE
jgi:hypothetical protein